MRRVRVRLGDLGWQAFALLAAAFMGVPLILVVLFSFNQSALTSLPLTNQVNRLLPFHAFTSSESIR